VAQTAGRSGDTSGRARFCRMLMWHPTSGRVSDVSGRVPYRFKYRVSALAATPHFNFNSFFVFLVSFSHGFSQNLGLFCPLLHLYLLSRYFASTCALFFSFILTVYLFFNSRIYFEIKVKHILCCCVWNNYYIIDLDCVGILLLICKF
jgi:hypothetical protein